MIGGAGLAVSLPANELRDFVPSGSVFDRAELSRASISGDLRHAVEIAALACAERQVPLRLVARPELYTHGASLDWLKTRLGGIEDHLCLSDGTTARPIPHMHNHLFLFRSGVVASARAFAALMRRAPELLASFDSQINSSVSVRVAGKIIKPPWKLFQVNSNGSSEVRLFRVRSSPASTPKLERIKLKDASALGKDYQFTYVPLTETALAHDGFVKSLAALISRGRGPSRNLLLRLPKMPGGQHPAECVKATWETFRRVSPRLPAAAPEWIWFATDDAPSPLLAKLGTTDLWMHESFEFWQQPSGYYAAFRNLEIFPSEALRARGSAALDLLESAMGRRPRYFKQADAKKTHR